MERRIVILQDLYWPESVVAAQLTEHLSAADEVRDYIRDRAFHQPSWETRDRYAGYFLKWFMPSVSLDDPVPVAWRAFHDLATLEHVMRWQFIATNPLIARFVDGPLSGIEPGASVNSAVDAFLEEQLGAVPKKSQARLRAALVKVGLLINGQQRTYHRLVADVTPHAVAIVIAHEFAPSPQAVAMETLLTDPWWKRLGLIDEGAVRGKLREAADARLLSRVLQMDTLDQITTKLSWAELSAGRVKLR